MASEIIARGTHPREKASWLSKMTLSWLNGVLKRGNKRPLQDKDLFPSLSENKMEVLMANIEKKWGKGTNHKQATKQRSSAVESAVKDTFMQESLLASFLEATSICVLNWSSYTIVAVS